MPTFLKILLLIVSTTAFTSIAKEINLAEGLNPGNLTAQLINASSDSQSVMVLLPGCGQSAIEFAEVGGFIELAKQKKIKILAIQQHKKNNIQACFNWFSELDNAAGNGEFQSIINYIEAVSYEKPVYLIGLSAGGAMASALMLQKPDYFAGVAIIAGIPYPCANNIVQAISCMKNGPNLSGKKLANLVLNQPGLTPKAWPKLVVITGTSDDIVNANNSEKMTNQYVQIVGAKQTEIHQESALVRQSVWRFSENKSVVLVQHNGLGHGLPISYSTSNPEPAVTSPFYLSSQLGTAELLMDLWF